MLCSPEVLAHYNPTLPTIVAADAAAEGRGIVLLQEQKSGESRPVCYASRALSDTEKRYAVIEKEALASVWACHKFSDYMLELRFTVEIDHKPLVPLLSSTNLAKLPPRIVRLRIRMMRFTPTVLYVPGKNQVAADTLSRATSESTDDHDLELN